MSYTGGKAGAGTFQRIINQIPPHDTYIEPFLGDGAILRRKRPAIRNVGVELDGDVLAAWIGDEVLPLELYHASGIDWLKHQFKLLRTHDSATVATAARNRGPAASRIQAATAADAEKRDPAGGVACLCGEDLDAAAGVAEPRGGPPSSIAAQLGDSSRSFVYCDPPYPIDTRRNAARLYRHEMSVDEHAELLRVLVRIPAMVLVSSYYSELYADHLRGWRLIRFKNQTRQGPAEECLWANFPRPTRLHDSRFVGRNKRERERIRRRARNWRRALESLPALERQVIIDAISGGW